MSKSGAAPATVIEFLTGTCHCT